MKRRKIFPILFLAFFLTIGCGHNRSDPESTGRAIATAFLEKKRTSFENFIPDDNTWYNRSIWDNGYFLEVTVCEGWNWEKANEIIDIWIEKPLDDYQIIDSSFVYSFEPEGKYSIDEGGGGVVFEYDSQKYLLFVSLKQISGKWYLDYGTDVLGNEHFITICTYQ